MTAVAQIRHIGFIGLGRMGQAIVPRLLEKGYAVTVWNRTEAKCSAMKALGAVVARSPEELVTRNEIVLTMVSDDESVLSLYQRLAPCAKSRRFVDMSTIQPSTHRTVAGLVQGQCGTYADAPVVGTVGPAKAGQLVCMVGAPAAEEALLGPVLQAFSRRQWWLGAVGLGATMKLSLNLILCSYWQLLGESLALAELGGLPRSLMLDAILDSPAALSMLPLKKDVILGNEASAAFDITGLFKDMRAISAEASMLGLPTPVLQAAMGQAMQALTQGLGDQDVAALTPYFVNAVKSSRFSNL